MGMRDVKKCQPGSSGFDSVDELRCVLCVMVKWLKNNLRAISKRVSENQHTPVIQTHFMQMVR